MSVGALFLMGSVAILLLGTFNELVAQTTALRMAFDTPAIAIARLHYLFAGIGIFLLAGLGFQGACGDRPSPQCETLARVGFWLMFVGFNLACFPTTLRRSHAFITDPLRFFTASVGPEVSFGAVTFVCGAVVCAATYAAIVRSVRV